MNHMKSDFTPRTLAKFQSALLDWFAAHRRDLPWRASRDPYRIWVAEIMLQQTRIAAVLPYYHRFLKKFPTVASLRRARLEEVLKLWSGLGYYSRARNLHRAAREIASRHDGKFPRSLEDALALPGIGRYTAAAVLSIAYDVPLAVLDGNVARVLARLGAIRGDLREPKTWRLLGERAQHLLALNAPGDWNQALMELGEVICTPQSPRCGLCPVSRWCQARAKNLTAEIPAVRKKRAPVKIRIAAAILRDPQGERFSFAIPARTTTCSSPACGNSPPWKSRATQNRSWPSTFTRFSRFRAASLHLEALPEARHGVTFRNITLLPFLAHVARLPKAPAHAHRPARRSREPSLFQRHPQNRRCSRIAQIAPPLADSPIRGTQAPNSLRMLAS